MSTSEFSEAVKKELRRDYEKWTDLLLQRRTWYIDQKIRLVDRTKESIIFFSSVAGTFLTIAIPLTKESSIFLTVSFWSFLITVLLGVFLIGITLFIDEKQLPIAKDEEMSVLKKLQLTALKGVNNPNRKNVEEYFNAHKTVISEIEGRKDSKLAQKIVNPLYFIFLLFFIFGFGGVMLHFICNNRF